MAVKAANILFNESGITREEIDFIIMATQSPDHFLPPTACIIQNKLNIPTTAGAFDFDLGCSGYVYGLALQEVSWTADLQKTFCFLLETP